MSVSSIASVPAPLPVSTQPADVAKAPDATDTSREAASQPALLAPLPPGQGARIDQIA
jgi:hypothetical protein